MSSALRVGEPEVLGNASVPVAVGGALADEAEEADSWREVDGRALTDALPCPSEGLPVEEGEARAEPEAAMLPAALVLKAPDVVGTRVGAAEEESCGRGVSVREAVPVPPPPATLGVSEPCAVRVGRTLLLRCAEAEEVGVAEAKGVLGDEAVGSTVARDDAVPPPWAESLEGVNTAVAVDVALGEFESVTTGVPVGTGRLGDALALGAAPVAVSTAVPVSVGGAVSVGGEEPEGVSVAPELPVALLVTLGRRRVEVGSKGVPLALRLCDPPAREAVAEPVGDASEEVVGVSEGSTGVGVDATLGLLVGRELNETAPASVVGLPTTDSVGSGAVAERPGELEGKKVGVGAAVSVLPAGELLPRGVAHACAVVVALARGVAVRSEVGVSSPGVSDDAVLRLGVGKMEKEGLGEEEEDVPRLSLAVLVAVRGGVRVGRRMEPEGVGEGEGMDGNGEAETKAVKLLVLSMLKEGDCEALLLPAFPARDGEGGTEKVGCGLAVAPEKLSAGVLLRVAWVPLGVSDGANCVGVRAALGEALLEGEGQGEAGGEGVSLREDRGDAVTPKDADTLGEAAVLGESVAASRGVGVAGREANGVTLLVPPAPLVAEAGAGVRVAAPSGLAVAGKGVAVAARSKDGVPVRVAAPGGDGVPASEALPLAESLRVCGETLESKLPLGQCREGEAEPEPAAPWPGVPLGRPGEAVGEKEGRGLCDTLLEAGAVLLAPGLREELSEAKGVRDGAREGVPPPAEAVAASSGEGVASGAVGEAEDEMLLKVLGEAGAEGEAVESAFVAEAVLDTVAPL